MKTKEKRPISKWSDLRIAAILNQIEDCLNVIDEEFPGVIPVNFGSEYRGWLIDDPSRIYRTYSEIVNVLPNSESDGPINKRALKALIKLNILYRYGMIDMVRQHIWRKTEERRKHHDDSWRNAMISTSVFAAIGGLISWFINDTFDPVITVGFMAIILFTGFYVHFSFDDEKHGLSRYAYNDMVMRHLIDGCAYDFIPVDERYEVNTRIDTIEDCPLAAMDYAIYFGKLFTSSYLSKFNLMEKNQELYEQMEYELITMFPFLDPDIEENEDKYEERYRKVAHAKAAARRRHRNPLSAGPTIVTLEKPEKSEEAEEPKEEKKSYGIYEDEPDE